MNGNTEDSWPLVITGDFRVANRRLSEWLTTADEELREMIAACRFPWDLLAIQERLMAVWEDEISGDVHPAAVIEGKLKLGKGSRILPGVFIEGNVVIGEGCKIGPNCYVRGSTAIGDNCIIGQSVEVKNSIILSGTSIGHLSYVGDSILGEKVNFGAGTIVSNFRHDARNHLSAVNGVQMDTGRLKFGTVVGDGVHTGIGTLVYPGRKIGAGMFTLPGDIVRRDLRP